MLGGVGKHVSLDMNFDRCWDAAERFVKNRDEQSGDLFFQDAGFTCYYR